MDEDLIKLVDAIELQFREVQRAAKHMTILIGSIRSMLVEKEICTLKELHDCDKRVEADLEPEFKKLL